MRERGAASEDPGARVALARNVGLVGATALVVVNMVGSSVYTLPASIAKGVGPLGIVAWVLTALGYLFVARVYARLGTRFPRTGGPYAYARAAFGEAAGFATVWCYWLSATLGNAAIVISAVGYVPDLWPELEGDGLTQFALASVLLWILCLVNVLGVRHGVRLQVVILVAGLAPLAVVGVLGLAAFDARNLEPFAPAGWSALPAGMALVMWAYSGVESAAVPAEEVQAPERTISRATYLGYALGTVIYLGLALGVAGALANERVAASTRPLALLAQETGGPWLASVLSVTAILACLGTVNGWILLAGRIPVAAAQDGLFFRSLARIHPRFRTPALGLVVGGVIANVMLVQLLAAEFLDVFDFVVRLTLFLTFVPHLFAAAADWRFAQGPRRLLSALAFLFVLFTTFALGHEACLLGLAALALGAPLFLALRRRAPPA
ncbi:MAG: amino acid permease [Planctomycetes bacterium]|nr:amino acid permease [Planctomycetota bacterium]